MRRHRVGLRDFITLATIVSTHLRTRSFDRARAEKHRVVLAVSRTVSEPWAKMRRPLMIGLSMLTLCVVPKDLLAQNPFTFYSIGSGSYTYCSGSQPYIYFDWQDVTPAPDPGWDYAWWMSGGAGGYAPTSNGSSWLPWGPGTQRTAYAKAFFTYDPGLYGYDWADPEYSWYYYQSNTISLTVPWCYGNITVNATLDGNPWTGLLNYTLTGPQTLNGGSVDSIQSTATNGSWTINYVSGGPPNANLDSVTPSSSQVLPGNVPSKPTINFTLHFSSIPVPAAPSGLTTTNTICGQIALNWTDNATGEAGYRIYRHPKDPPPDTPQVSYGGNTYRIIADLAANSSSYISTVATDDPTPGNSYSYIVTAYNGTGDSTISAQNAAGPSLVAPCAEIYWSKDHIYSSSGGSRLATSAPLPLDQIPPSGPSNLSYSNVTSNSVDLSWTAAADSGGSSLAGYKIYRGALPVGTVGAGTTSFTDQALQSDTAYTYTVRAFDNDQNHSGSSNSVSPTTQP